MPPEVLAPAHPYYPLGLELVGYLPNAWSTWTLLSIFATTCTAIFALTYPLVTRVQPKISSSDLWIILWFVLCGCIHAFLEGYYVYNFRDMPSMQDLFGQLWKEYSLSDSRYQTQDAFVVCMEAVTSIFWGPLSFTLAVLIVTAHPMRHPLQVVISLGQFYGNVLYYGTSLFDHYVRDLSYSRPEPAIFWGYFIFCNAFWVVIPLMLLYSSLSTISCAFVALPEYKPSRGTSNKGQKAE